MDWVYLDQCAVSCLALRPDEKWDHIRRLLKNGLEMGRIISPMPSETFMESAPHSQVFITDGYVENLCKRAIPIEYQFTNVFSVTQLEKICAALS